MHWIVVTAAIVWLAVLPAPLAAQTPPRDPHAVQPERPTVATHAGTVAPGWLEIEAGVEVDRDSEGSHSVVAPILLKLGLAPRLQLSVQLPVDRPAVDPRIAVGDLAIGVKWRLLDRAPVVGDFAILPSLKVPSGSAEVGTGTTDLGLLFISSHELGPIEMDLNYGYTYRGGEGRSIPRSATVWTVSLGGPARGALGWVAEIFGFPRTSGPAATESTIAFLGGPTVQVRTWLVLDGGVIVPIAGQPPRAWYVGGVYNVGRLWTAAHSNQTTASECQRATGGGRRRPWATIGPPEGWR